MASGDGAYMEEFKNSFTSSLKLAVDEMNGQISITVFQSKIWGERLTTSASVHLTPAGLS